MEKPKKSFYFIAGEPSGDLHGAALLKALKQIHHNLEFKGIGGEAMQKEGLIPLFPFSDFQVMGFTDIIRAYPRLRRHFFAIGEKILKEKPNAVIFIDYPGFNLRLATHLRKKGFQGKLIHYIAPSVWAHSKGRIQTMAKSLDLLLTILPFEKPLFNGTNLNVEYVGNPLIEAHDNTKLDEEPILALFPGSRPAEIKRNLPFQIKAAEKFIEKNPEYRVGISVSSHELQNEVSKLLQNAKFQWFLAHSPERYSLMKRASLALAKSGTVILELALHGCPTVVIYKLSPLNYFIAKYIYRIQIPFFSLPNILLQKPLFKEFYKVELPLNEIVGTMETMARQRPAIEKEALELQNILGSSKASEEAAKHILFLR